LEKIVITGGKRLKGSVKVGAAKNAILPIIAASLLAEGESVLEETPGLEDVITMTQVLTALGVENHFEGDALKINANAIISPEAPYEYVRKMRASFLVLGPLLARLGHTKISLPGGCNIGSRPIDLHLKGFIALGADVNIGHGIIEARAQKLRGAKIYLDYPSVGATENIMMAATLAEGTTILENAAEEPEVVDLANFINSMGGEIKGAGTDVIKIEGVRELKGTRYTVIPDRIEAGTFMVAAAITGGEVLIENAIVDHIKPLIAKLREADIEVLEMVEGLLVRGSGRINPIDVKTLPYPGFPTDMQSQMMSMLTKARGTSMVTETVFENRFMHVGELKRMGANIKVEGRTAIIQGVERLSGAPVKATDLRAGAALAIAGLAAEGTTEITNVFHIDRGYVDFEKKLAALGADIERVSG
jgi:UDP-N-acetylglucosamine 1-carboxyvinyltransferase